MLKWMSSISPQLQWKMFPPISLPPSSVSLLPFNCISKSWMPPAKEGIILWEHRVNSLRTRRPRGRGGPRSTASREARPSERDTGWTLCENPGGRVAEGSSLYFSWDKSSRGPSLPTQGLVCGIKQMSPEQGVSCTDPSKRAAKGGFRGVCSRGCSAEGDGWGTETQRCDGKAGEGRRDQWPCGGFWEPGCWGAPCLHTVHFLFAKRSVT